MRIKGTKICFVGNMVGRNPGFVTTQGQIVADLLSREGYTVTCVSSKLSRPMRLAEIVATLIKGFRGFDVIVVEVYSGLGMIIADVAGRLARLFRTPLIMVLHGGNLPDFMRSHPLWTKSVLNRATSLVAPSSFLSTEIGSFGYEISEIRNVIDIDNYPYRERSQIQPRLIWMRSFHPLYNPLMAIAVLADLRKSHPRASLTMAGVDKGMEGTVRRTVNDLGLSDAVRFPGFLNAEEKIVEFDSADIYLNTNLIDNMPVSVIEACAFGLPVVASRVGGVPFLIDHGENGMLVPGEDVNAMTVAIMKLLSDPLLTRKISRGARQLAERSDWKSVRNDWENVLNKTLGESFSTTGEILPNETSPV